MVSVSAGAKPRVNAKPTREQTMAEQTMERRAQDEESDELQDEPETVEEDDAGAASGTTSWAVRGAVVGAVAGGAIGAGLGALLSARPNLLESARDAVEGPSRDVAKAAAVAVGQVVTTRSVGNLVSTAKEAAAAAAGAARDTLVAMRSSGS
jgi:hypothetical protein